MSHSEITFIFAVTLMLLLLILTFLITRRIMSAVLRSERHAVRVISVLRCPVCSFETSREFRSGDYVGLTLDERCPRDDSRLVVSRIFVERARYEKEI